MDGREIWSLSAGGMPAQLGSCSENGKIKLGSSNMCLSQSGPAPGNADLAASSSVMASSTLDPAHGAALAVDGLDSSFWASKLDEVSPVTLTLELDEPAPGGGS